MRSFRHWRPRYVYDRSRNLIWNRLHSDWPWFTPAAVRFLEVWLTTSDHVFEWGSGRSTIWFARYACSVTSIETSENWFAKVHFIVQRDNLRNVNLLLAAEPDDAGTYASFIRRSVPSVDLIVVDGLHRDFCALASIQHLKPGGLLLVDNANWYLPSTSVAPLSRRVGDGPASALWSDFLMKVQTWRKIWTSNGVTDTAIWVKPIGMAEAPASR